MPSVAQQAINKANAARARDLYMASRVPSSGAADWRAALKEARTFIAAALRESNYLHDPAKALQRNGLHMLAFRQFMAPPMSQDQFQLVCPTWNKRSEFAGRVLTPVQAAAASATFLDWLDRAAAPWVGSSHLPNRAELRNALQRTSVLIAQQRVQTLQRNRASAAQESAVVTLLLGMGWTKEQSRLIDTRAAVSERTFMHKTRFATATTTPQEVDVACGLSGTIVAAIECKVTNDETNSVKRVNDVLKKARAWHQHWGSFVETVAVLQGVIAAKDVDRLSDDNVHVFWSHDLAALEAWLNSKLR